MPTTTTERLSLQVHYYYLYTKNLISHYYVLDVYINNIIFARNESANCPILQYKRRVTLHCVICPRVKINLLTQLVR